MSRSHVNLRLAIAYCLFLATFQKTEAQHDLKALWAKGIIAEHNASVYSMARDGDGNLYLCGYLSGTADFDPGPGVANLTSTSMDNDVFIAKYDSSGNHIWSGNIGGGMNAWSNAIAVDAVGNMYVTGTFNGTTDFDPGPGKAELVSVGSPNIFIAKYDPSGAYLWAKKPMGTTAARSRDLSIDEEGNLCYTGFFAGSLDLDPGPGTFTVSSTGGYDIFLAKYRPSGEFLWGFSFGGSGNDFGSDLQVLRNGDILLAGNFSNAVDFDPGPGTNVLNSSGISDIFLVRYDRQGYHLWAKNMGGSFTNNYSVSVDWDENIFLSGIFYGTSDFDPGPGNAPLSSVGDENAYLSKYDPNGNYLWAVGIGGTPLYIDYRPVATDQNGYAYLTGYFEGTVDLDPGPGTMNVTSQGSADIFLVKFDPAGNLVWGNRMGGASSDFGITPIHDQRGKLYLTGHFDGATDLDPGPGTAELSCSPWATSTFIAAYSTKSAKTWIGGNGNWSTPANWSDGMAPIGTDILTVDNGNPRLDVDFSVAGSLTLSGTGGLTVSPGKTLSIAGSADFASRPVVFQSNAFGTAQLGTVSGTLNGATNVTVERYIPNTGRRWRLLTAPLENISVNAAWQNGQTWSGSTLFPGDGTGTLITGQQQGNALNANGRGFDFWSAIANSSASVMSYTQRPGQGVWTPLPNTTTANAFGGEKAYLLFVRGPRASTYSSGTANAATTVRPNGALRIGDRNLSIDGTKGYTLIGNPYASQIDFDAIYRENGNSSVIKRQLWMWDATAGTSGNFQAVVYSGDRYVEVPAKFHSPGQASPLTAIQSGHGFFVLPLNSSGGTLKIRETHKISSQPASPNILLNKDRTPRIWLNLARKSNDGAILTSDGVMVAYDDAYRMEATDSDDALKLENIDENLAIANDGATLTADARPLSRMNDPIKLRVWNLSTGAYRFEAKIEGMEDRGTKVFLEDRLKGARTPLRTDGGITSIEMVITDDASSRAEDRFRIIFEKAAVNASLTPETEGDRKTLSVYPNPMTGRTLNVQLQNLPTGEYTLQLVGSDGKVVASKKVRHEGGSTLHRIELGGALSKGVYRISCVKGEGSIGSETLVVQ